MLTICCSRCGEDKPWRDFPKSYVRLLAGGGGEFGRYHQPCRACKRWENVKQVYGLSREAWEALFTSQGEVCAICGSEDSGSEKRYWHTDHDHVTGKVRGILCMLCNIMLGNAQDDPDTLRAGADYLDLSRDSVV